MVATGLASALPIIVSIVRIAMDGWVPLGDDALIAVRSFEVLGKNPPLLGMPSTGPTGVLAEQAFHLGPLLFGLLALPARYLGPSSLAMTVGVVNVACVVGCVTLARRRGGLPLMFATAIAMPVMLLSIPVDAWSDVWNPAAALLPFTLLIFLAWSLACGEHRLLPLAVLIASFVSQCHLIYLLPVLGTVTVGVGGLLVNRVVRRRSNPDWLSGDPGSPGRWVVIAALVGLLCWTPPLIDQATNDPGNLVLLARAARADDATLGSRVGARAVVRAVGIPPWWLRQPRGALERIYDLDRAPGVIAAGTALLVLAGLVAAGISGWRRRRVDVAVANLLALVLSGALLLGTSSVPAASFASTGYGLWWATPVGMFAWLALGWSVATLRRTYVPSSSAGRTWTPKATAAGLALAAAAGTAVALAGSPPDEPFDQLRTVTERLEDELPADAAVRVGGRWTSETVFTGAGFQLGIVYWLLREGHAVSAPGLPDLGSRYGAGEAGYDRLIRVQVDAPPGGAGRSIARLPVPGGDADNPFQKAAPVRIVAVSILPTASDR